MKATLRLIALTLALTTILEGCSSNKPVPDPNRPTTRETVYIGWVRFAGEFMLYPDTTTFEAAQTMHCVSGALPPEKQKDAERLSGQRVQVRARPVEWSSLPEDALSLDNAGSPITNWCGDRVVLFASDMRLD
jgi:hypothetical protein